MQTKKPHIPIRSRQCQVQIAKNRAANKSNALIIAVQHLGQECRCGSRFRRLARGDQIIAFIPEISTPKPRNPYNIIQTRPQRRRGRASGTHGCRAPRRLPPGSVTVPIRRGGKWSVESCYKNFLVVVPFSEMPAMSCSLPGETTKSSKSGWIYKAAEKEEEDPI